MAVFVVSHLPKRLTFVNWDKNGNTFHIGNNRIYRRVPLARVHLEERRLDQVQCDDVPYRWSPLRRGQPLRRV